MFHFIAGILLLYSASTFATPVYQCEETEIAYGVVFPWGCEEIF